MTLLSAIARYVRKVLGRLGKKSSVDPLFLELADCFSKMKPDGVNQETIYNFAFGALYALAKAEQTGYPKQSAETARSARRALEVCALAREMVSKKWVPQAEDGEWLGGFCFNDALFRAVVAFEHLLRYYTRLNGNESLQTLVDTALSEGFNIEEIVPSWTEIKDEVNRLKHRSWEYGQGPEIPYPDAVKIVRGVVLAMKWVFENPPKQPSVLDPWLLKVFLRQLARQCEFAILAFEDMEGVLQQMQAHDCSVRDGQARFWASVQNLLVAAGNISKLLWPPRPLIPDRGEQLRQILSVSDESLLKSRSFRNHFEHFDERLEEFFLVIPTHKRNFIDSNISPGGIGSLMSGVSQDHVLRHYDQVAKTLTYRNDVFQLGPVMQIIRDLLAKAEEQERN